MEFEYLSSLTYVSEEDSNLIAHLTQGDKPFECCSKPWLQLALTAQWRMNPILKRCGRLPVYQFKRTAKTLPGPPHQILAALYQNAAPTPLHRQREQQDVPGLLYGLGLGPLGRLDDLHLLGRNTGLCKLDLPLPASRWRISNVAWHRLRGASE